MLAMVGLRSGLAVLSLAVLLLAVLSLLAAVVAVVVAVVAAAVEEGDAVGWLLLL